jgi:hypothetical protein
MNKLRADTLLFNLCLAHRRLAHVRTDAHLAAWEYQCSKAEVRMTGQDVWRAFMRMSGRQEASYAGLKR